MKFRDIVHLLTVRYIRQGLNPFVAKEIIKVITGQREVGKSFILFQFIEDILGLYPSANIIYLNKELKQFDFVTSKMNCTAM